MKNNDYIKYLYNFSYVKSKIFKQLVQVLQKNPADKQCLNKSAQKWFEETEETRL